MLFEREDRNDTPRDICIHPLIHSGPPHSTGIHSFSFLCGLQYRRCPWLYSGVYDQRLAIKLSRHVPEVLLYPRQLVAMVGHLVCTMRYMNANVMSKTKTSRLYMRMKANVATWLAIAMI